MTTARSARRDVGPEPGLPAPDRRRSDAQLPRLAGQATLVFSALLPLIEVARIGVLQPPRDFWIALAATAAYLPLHLRHVAHGLRGLRPAHGGWTLGAMVLIMAAAGLLIGDWWAMMLASLIVSVLLVVPPRWSAVLVPAILLVTFLLGYGPDETAYSPGSLGLYLVFAVSIRASALFVMIWLVAATRQLNHVRAQLSRTAVRHERSRIDDALREQLSDAVRAIAAKAQHARRSAIGADGRLDASLADLTATARQTLERVRRILDGSDHAAPLETGDAVDPPDRVLRGDTRSELLATVRRSRWLLVLVFLPQLAYVLGLSATGLAFYPSGHAEYAVPAMLAIGALSLRHAYAAANGRLRGGVATCLALVALAVAPWFFIDSFWVHTQWIWGAGFFVGAAIAIAFGGHFRVAALVLPGVVLAVAARTDTPAELSLAYDIWSAVYMFTIGVMLAGSQYGAVRLIQVVDELYATRYALAAEAVSSERQRVSRDLHDLLTQTLSAICLKSDLALRQLSRDPAAAVAEVGDVADLAVDLARDIRDATYDERTMTLASEAGNAVALLRAAEITTSSHLLPEPLPSDIDMLLGWAVREGATNVLRHSAATWCRIEVDRHEHGGFTLVMTNDRAEPASTDPGHGLNGLTARAAAVGGVVRAGRTEDGGFELRVETTGDGR